MSAFQSHPLRRVSFLLAGPVILLFLAACSSLPGSNSKAAVSSSSAVSSPSPGPAREIPFALIEKLAVDMGRWHFNSTDEIDGILDGAQALGITLSADDLNNILDEDERKGLWRIGAAEYPIGALYGEEAQVVFKIRHSVSLAGLWRETARTEQDPAVRIGYIIIAAGIIGIAAGSVREVPANWDCWEEAGCEPRPPMRPVTFRLDAEIVSEGNDLYEGLLHLSRTAAPDMGEFSQWMGRAAAWDVRVYETLKGLS